jgi:hypothetical protein
MELVFTDPSPIDFREFERNVYRGFHEEHGHGYLENPILDWDKTSVVDMPWGTRWLQNTFEDYMTKTFVILF